MNPLLRTTLAVLSIGTACAAPLAAGAMTLTVPESAIRSLAGAPEIVSARSWRDGQGRPGLTLTLRFVNDCLADAGADVAGATDGRGTLFAVIGQRIDPAGCPDIFRPVERQVAIAFDTVPGAAQSEDLRIVARGGSGSALIAPQPGVEPTGRIAAARPLGDSGVLAPFRFGAIAPGQSGAGYTVTGRLGLAPGCRSDQVQALLFEIPDADGTPSQDALATLVPAQCADPAAAEEVSITVQTPQRNAGRRVYVLNGDTPVTRL